MSADGNIVVGSRGNFGPAFRWTAESGAVDIGGAGPRTRISLDGKTIVSEAKDTQGVVCAARGRCERHGWPGLGEAEGHARFPLGQ